jgi:hypothetical protein
LNALTNNKTGLPLEHYSRIYQGLDPVEISRRTGLGFDSGASAFRFRILGEEHLASFPRYALIDSAGEESAGGCEKILFLRFLCEGRYVRPLGKRLAYNEIPWGSVYYRNFEGRCLKRGALAFGGDIQGFMQMIEQNPALRSEKLNVGDAGYRFEFINGFFISLIIWEGDDEFPPSAQILFDDNFALGFTAEDLAVAGEVLVERLDKLKTLRQGAKKSRGQI